MDWNLVQLFVEVVDAGSMSEAARRRGITRSGVSQRLKQLEQQVNAQLLRRTTRDLKPTDIGMTLYEHGKRIALQFEAARFDVASLGQTLSGLVRISIPIGIGQIFLAPTLIDFARKHPNVNLRVIFNNRFSNLIEADVDIAIKIATNPPEDVVARDICGVRWYFYSTPEYLATLDRCEELEDLDKASFLSPHEGRKVELEVRSADQVATVTLVPRLTSESVLFLRACTEAHMGISLLPEYIVRELVADGTIVRVLPRFSSNRIAGRFFILTMPNRFPTPATQALIDVLRAALPEIVGEEPSDQLSAPK